MAYNFLNPEVKKFLSVSLDQGNMMFSRSVQYESVKATFPVQTDAKDKEILSHDFETFSKLIGFLDGTLKTFILYGFMGSGKSAMINLLPKLIDSSVLYFRVNCFESTHLDDVLLTLHKEFVRYHNEKKIILPKVESTVFTDRINAFIKAGNGSMLFVFDSVDSERYPLQVDIVNFIKHISGIDKIKVVVTSRNLASNDLPVDSSSNMAVIKLAGKEEYISMLNEKGIETEDELYEKSFIATKGHYLYISLFINVILLLNISLKSLFNDYTKKNLTIFDFLVSKVLTLIPEKFFKTLWFLTLIRTGVSENFLITQKLSTKDELAYLEERMLLCRESGVLYLKDYVKSGVIGTVSPETKKEIHKYLHELYESQLPKKPSERDLSISRSTMRRESAYHKSLAEEEIPVKQVPNATGNIDIGYIGYMKTAQNDWNFSDSTLASRKDRSVKPAPRGGVGKFGKSRPVRRFEISEDEMEMLNRLNLNAPTAENMAEKHKEIYVRREALAGAPPVTKKDDRPSVEEINRETLADVMREAATAEEDFDYEKALSVYNKAYSMTEEAGYSEAKPVIMMQTALCHRKMQNNTEALRCFEAAYKLYGVVNPEKANSALLNMAQIYTETYNHELAKVMYEKILLSRESTDPKTIIRVLLDIAEIEINNADTEKASQYYTDAADTAEKIDNKPLLCECCFKYALCLDDEGLVEDAFKYYVKCVKTSSDYSVNSYISSAYANIAGIYEDQNITDKAVKYYEEAMKVDIANNNYDGLYFAYSKLAELYKTKSVTIATDYLFKALDAAKKLDDKTYIATTYIQAGDYYYRANANEDALKSYLLAKAVLVNQPNPENIRKIDVRINDMKSKLGSSLFNEITAEIKNSENK